MGSGADGRFKSEAALAGAPPDPVVVVPVPVLPPATELDAPPAPEEVLELDGWPLPDVDGD